MRIFSFCFDPKTSVLAAAESPRAKKNIFNLCFESKTAEPAAMVGPPEEKKIPISLYTNAAATKDDFSIETPATLWFRKQIDEVKKKGNEDPAILEKMLDAALRYNRELYDKVLQQELDEKARRQREEQLKESGCVLK
jgi:hypothetical protein